MRWLRRIAGALVLLVLTLTLASCAFNLATADEGKPAHALWHGKFVRADGVLTAYRTWGHGNGEPVVLVGGFVEPTFAWEGVAPLLAARGHRVYALDLDGFGFSERKGPWTLGEWSDQLQDFMRTLRIGRSIVVGHSLGAAVAVEAARRGLATRIVLLDGDALHGGGPPALLRSVIAHTPFTTSALRIATRWDYPVRKILEQTYGPSHPNLDHAEVARWTAQFRVKGAEHALRTMGTRQIVGFSSPQLRRVRTSAVVAWGEHDTVDSRDAGEQTARDLHARFVLIPRAGHLSMLVEPRAVARVILRAQ